MKNILFIQHSPLLGGASNALVDILGSLDKARYRAVVLCSARGPAVDRIKALGIKIYIKKFGLLPNYAYQVMGISWDSLIRILKFVVLMPISNFTILKIVISESIDVIYINSLVSVGCGFLPKMLNIPLLMHFREFPIMNRFGVLQHRFAKKISTQIICASKAIRYHISSVILESLVVYDWVDTKKFNLKRFENNSKSKWGIPKDLMCIGMVGELREQKGLFLFYEAANILLGRGRKYIFLYVGGFTKVSDQDLLLQKIKRSNHKKAFFFTGWITDVPSAVSVMDIVVCPNIKAEGFGKTIIEAGAMEKPVVASNIPPTDELIVNKETGLLVNPNNAEELAKAIEFLIENPSERKRIGNKARKRVMTHFSKEKNIKEVLKTIDNVSRRLASNS